MVVEYYNEGVYTVAAQADYTLPANVETLVLSGSATSGTGNGLDNYLSANGTSSVGVTLDGAAGADMMSGTFGNDTYAFGRGDGSDTISSLDQTLAKTDTLQLGVAIAATDIAVNRQSNDLLISILGTSDSVRVRNHFLGGGNQLDQIRFADGTSWNATAITGHLSALDQTGPSGAVRARGPLIEEMGVKTASRSLTAAEDESWAETAASVGYSPEASALATGSDELGAPAQLLVAAMASFEPPFDRLSPWMTNHQFTAMPLTSPQQAF